MARAPSTNGMFDIRTTAMLQDVTFASNPCAPGASKSRNVYHLYGNPVVPDSFTDENAKASLKKFDNAKDWVALFASMAIVGTVLGIVQSFAVLIPTMLEAYNEIARKKEEFLVPNECLLIGAATYALFIIVGPISSAIIGWMGARLTCIFGLLLFFFGLILNGLILHRAVLYCAQIVLVGIGGSLAYTAAISTTVDRFRQSLPLALILLSISAPLGTFAYYGILYLIVSKVRTNPYQWAIFVLAIIILVLIAATHFLPSKQRHSEPFNSNNSPRQRAKQVKKCVENSEHRYNKKKCIPDPEEQLVHPNQRSCLCVIVIDVSVLSDTSFMVLVAIVFFASLTAFVPYLFLLIFMDILRVTPSVPIIVILWYCLASMGGRVFTIVGNDYTFMYNRTAFQLCLIASGFFIISLIYAGTYGWVVGWAIAAGFLQGAITTLIPRVTMQTVPRKWVSSAWAYIVVASGLGLFTGVVLIVSTLFITKRYVHGFVTIGLAQIIAGVFAFVLPNEEEGEAPPPVPLLDRLTANINALPPPSGLSYYRDNTSRRFDQMSYNCGSNVGYGYGGNQFSYRKSCLTDTILNSNRSIANAYLSKCSGIDKTYCSECPICTKVGCIPQCCPDCVPGGLTSSLPMQSCLDCNSNELEPKYTFGNHEPKPTSSPEASTNMKEERSKKASKDPKPYPYTPSPSESAVKVKRVSVEIRHSKSRTGLDSNCPLPAAQTSEKSK